MPVTIVSVHPYNVYDYYIVCQPVHIKQTRAQRITIVYGSGAKPPAIGTTLTLEELLAI